MTSDPIRFRVIQAMERRAADLDGEARRVIDEKLMALVNDYAAGSSHARTETQPPSPRPLAGLVDELRQRAPGAYPELELLEYFRQTWSNVSADKQLRQSQEQVPGNAGPLNSSNLVHRSLSLMRELSPGYLQHFLSYADSLSWLEQLNSATAPAAPSVKKKGKAR